MNWTLENVLTDLDFLVSTTCYLLQIGGDVDTIDEKLLDRFNCPSKDDLATPFLLMTTCEKVYSELSFIPSADLNEAFSPLTIQDLYMDVLADFDAILKIFGPAAKQKHRSRDKQNPVFLDKEKDVSSTNYLPCLDCPINQSSSVQSLHQSCVRDVHHVYQTLHDLSIFIGMRLAMCDLFGAISVGSAYGSQSPEYSDLLHRVIDGAGTVKSPLVIPIAKVHHYIHQILQACIYLYSTHHLIVILKSAAGEAEAILTFLITREALFSSRYADTVAGICCLRRQITSLTKLYERMMLPANSKNYTIIKDTNNNASVSNHPSRDESSQTTMIVLWLRRCLSWLIDTHRVIFSQVLLRGAALTTSSEHTTRSPMYDAADITPPTPYPSLHESSCRAHTLPRISSLPRMGFPSAASDPGHHVPLTKPPTYDAFISSTVQKFFSKAMERLVGDDRSLIRRLSMQSASDAEKLPPLAPSGGSSSSSHGPFILTLLILRKGSSSVNSAIDSSANMSCTNTMASLPKLPFKTNNRGFICPPREMWNSPEVAPHKDACNATNVVEDKEQERNDVKLDCYSPSTFSLDNEAGGGDWQLLFERSLSYDSMGISNESDSTSEHSAPASPSHRASSNPLAALLRNRSTSSATSSSAPVRSRSISATSVTSNQRTATVHASMQQHFVPYSSSRKLSDAPIHSNNSASTSAPIATYPHPAVSICESTNSASRASFSVVKPFDLPTVSSIHTHTPSTSISNDPLGIVQRLPAIFGLRSSSVSNATALSDSANTISSAGAIPATTVAETTTTTSVTATADRVVSNSTVEGMLTSIAQTLSIVSSSSSVSAIVGSTSDATATNTTSNVASTASGAGVGSTSSLSSNPHTAAMTAVAPNASLKSCPTHNSNFHSDQSSSAHVSASSGIVDSASSSKTNANHHYLSRTNNLTSSESPTAISQQDIEDHINISQHNRLASAWFVDLWAIIASMASKALAEATDNTISATDNRIGSIDNTSDRVSCPNNIQKARLPFAFTPLVSADSEAFGFQNNVDRIGSVYVYSPRWETFRSRESFVFTRNNSLVQPEEHARSSSESTSVRAASLDAAASVAQTIASPSRDRGEIAQVNSEDGGRVTTRTDVFSVPLNDSLALVCLYAAVDVAVEDRKNNFEAQRRLNLLCTALEDLAVQLRGDMLFDFNATDVEYPGSMKFEI